MNAFEKIDHIGIAVESIEDARQLFEEVLGLEFQGSEDVEEQGVRVAFFALGESMIELLEPLDESGPVAKFLAKNGPGIHHIAMGTSDIEAARSIAEDGGLRLLSDQPLDGAHGKLISFVHPRDTFGVLLEFTQRQNSSK